MGYENERALSTRKVDMSGKNERVEITGIEFGAQELQAIRAFIHLINEPGVWSVLELRAFQAEGASQQIKQVLRRARKDINKRCGTKSRQPAKDPKDVVDAAVSFAMLVRLASNSSGDGISTDLQLPDEMLPDEALVEKCLRAFYSIVRYESAPYLEPARDTTPDSDEGEDDGIMPVAPQLL